MNKLFIASFAIFMAQAIVACPTRVMNDSDFVIGLADRDLGDSPADNQFVEIVQPGKEATKDVTPAEHGFYVYIQQGSRFIKKLEVIFKFCGNVVGGGNTEKMKYSDIDQEKIVTKEDGQPWAKGKFTVNKFNS
jgi:hypothetical protein